MEFLCRLCDWSVIENESEYNHYLTTFRKKNGKSFTINNINLDDVNKILNDYTSSYNKNVDFFSLIVNL